MEDDDETKPTKYIEDPSLKTMKYNTNLTNKATAETGNGEYRREPKRAMSIEEMYYRMLHTNQIAPAMRENLYHGNKAQAEQLIEQARKLPMYLSEAERTTIIDELSSIAKKQRDLNKKQFDDLIKKGIEKQQQEQEEEQGDY